MGLDHFERLSDESRCSKRGGLAECSGNEWTVNTPVAHADSELSSREAGDAARVIAGLYAAGEVAGFGGGGVHGYNALEGIFRGGCLFSGRPAGRHAARAR